jgi:hypothetical protein
MLAVKPPYYVAPPDSLPWYAHLMGMTWLWSDIFTPDFGGLKASHGYDPAIPEMHGIFYAWGAGVAQGKEIPQLDMVDVHPTTMSLLGLQPGSRSTAGHRRGGCAYVALGLALVRTCRCRRGWRPRRG